MSEMKTVQGILPIIKSIASNCETGQLDIDYAGTHGTLLFRKGRLIHARLGSLTGFQAVNAAVALRFAQYRFDPLASISHSGSITGSERVVLRRFFGIEAAEMEEPSEAVAEPEIDWSAPPAPVIPLAVVQEIPRHDLEDTPTVEVQRLNRRFAPSRARSNRRPVWLAVGFAVLVGLAIGVIAFRARTNTSPQVASVAILAKSESQPVAESKPEVKPAAPAVTEVKQTAPAVTEVKQAAPAVSEVKQGTPAAAVASEVKQVAPAAPAVATASEPKKRDAKVADLNGEWQVVNTIQKTGYKSYGNMQVGFRVSINQNGKEFTAKGEKISENGKTLPPKSRTPINVTGSIDGDNVIGTFIEDGKMRRTNGRFVWKLKNDGLTGTFATNAANSSGRSAVTRQ